MVEHPTAPARPDPRILIEHSDYWHTNKGDLAMLDVTIARIHQRWPQARVGVLTEAPQLLRAYLPRAEPINPWGSRAWASGSLLARLSESAGPRAVGPAAHGWIKAHERVRRTARALREATAARTNSRRADGDLALDSPNDEDGQPSDTSHDTTGVPTNTRAAVGTSSLVLALGGGYLTDADPAQSHRVLDLLDYAARLGKPTAMIGQGLGPIEQEALARKFASVLPTVDLVALREARRGPELLDRAGVPAGVVRVTGDDAIELAYEQSADRVGSDIGICLRVADYSPVGSAAQQAVKHALQSVASSLQAGLVPVLIAEYEKQDRRSTLPLVTGYERARPALGRFAAPREVASQVGQCRVLVTGAYHAAVFALSQGIPVVALTTTRYYDDKFLGLAEMFRGGLDLVRLDSNEVTTELVRAMNSAWERSPALRAQLRERAEEQIVSSRAALDQVLDLVAVQARGEVDP